MDKKDFKNFQEGFYNYSGELVYVVKEPKNLVMKTPGSPTNLEGEITGGKIIYFSGGPLTDFHFDFLKSVNPYDFLKQKTSSLIDFIKFYQKTLNKANLSEQTQPKTKN